MSEMSNASKATTNVRSFLKKVKRKKKQNLKDKKREVVNVEDYESTEKEVLGGESAVSES